METLVTRTAGCKINLSLRITGVRNTGWHELDTLFIPLDQPCDKLEIRFTSSVHGLSVLCDEAGIDPYNNTLTKAYSCFAERTGYAPGMRVLLRKGIPHGAGLGGGSADAAALLLLLNQHAPQPLSMSQLTEVATQVGADVPFFLLNRPCRAHGIGEMLIPLESPLLDGALHGNHLILLCPAIRVATPWAYRAWDSSYAAASLSKNTSSSKKNLTTNHVTDKEMAFRTLSSGNILTTPQESSVFWLENSFEIPVFAQWPRLRELKEELLRYGARAAVMSGSGAALVGVFRTESDRQQFVNGFRDQDVTVYCHAL